MTTPPKPRLPDDDDVDPNEVPTIIARRPVVPPPPEPDPEPTVPPPPAKK